ncbi:HAD family hydrolase, partial [Candidatus Woesearchaeota archaeon]|nr:HAD family hydrolase [Candidatus Woesearchaeota archaeon]
KTFLVTGSPQDLMEGKIAVLEQKVLGSNFFDMAISANPKSGNPNKTKPDTLIECMRTLEVPPERTLYVGNSAEDMDFAEKAGVKPIIVKRDIDFPGMEYANIISSLYSLRNMI